MDRSGIFDIIKNLLAIIGTLFGILANAPKLWENVCKRWEFIRPWFTKEKNVFCVKRLRQFIDTNEAREKSPTPPESFCLHVFDTVSLATATSISTSMSGGGGGPFIKRL